MLTINCNMSSFPTEVLIRDIKVGTLFLGKIGEISSLFLRTYNGIVDLHNPRNTWTLENLPVHNIKVVDGTLTVTGISDR